MAKDKDGYELITRRVKHVLRIGYIGDSEGRTWAKDLLSEQPFPTREEAQTAMENHPDLFLNQWGNYQTKHSYGQCGIFVVEEVVK